MADYINRQVAIKALDAVPYDDTSYEGAVGEYFRAKKDKGVIESVPSADVEPVRHGRWHSRHYYREASKSYDCEVFVCGECQAEFSYDAETGVQASNWHYCPNCGARMDGK